MLRLLLLVAPICMLAAHANAYDRYFSTPTIVPRADVAACSSPYDLEKYSNLIIAGRFDRANAMDCFHIKEGTEVTLLHNDGDYVQVIAKKDGKEYDVWSTTVMFDDSDDYKTHAERTAESAKTSAQEAAEDAVEKKCSTVVYDKRYDCIHNGLAELNLSD